MHGFLRWLSSNSKWVLLACVSRLKMLKFCIFNKFGVFLSIGCCIYSSILYFSGILSCKLRVPMRGTLFKLFLFNYLIKKGALTILIDKIAIESCFCKAFICWNAGNKCCKFLFWQFSIFILTRDGTYLWDWWHWLPFVFVVCNHLHEIQNYCW